MRLSCVPTWAFGMVSDSDGSYQADGRVLDLNCILELLGSWVLSGEEQHDVAAGVSPFGISSRCAKLNSNTVLGCVCE